VIGTSIEGGTKMFGCRKKEPREFFHGYAVDPVAEDKTVIALFAVYRSYIIHQYELMHHRTTWFVGINAFLFTTYGFTIQKRMELALAATINGSIQPCGIIRSPLAYLDVFLIFLCMMGFSLSIVSLIILRSANNPIEQLHRYFDATMAGMGRKIPGGSDIPPTGIRFVLPYIVGGFLEKNMQTGRKVTARIPYVMMVFWCAIAIGTEIFPIIHGDYFFGASICPSVAPHVSIGSCCG
jgi:hypothetical protein